MFGDILQQLVGGLNSPLSLIALLGFDPFICMLWRNNTTAKVMFTVRLPEGQGLGKNFGCSREGVLLYASTPDMLLKAKGGG